ncbi:sugar ABC transporter substrate-binding protein [Rubrobacter xylanophilus]|uniref:Sugar ABC transporter substrate-binding protein n=1 Tax=Rubrobacter xylanophilus TaxID=49319 RepID=A0A510HH23_9ACTN|nr:substrate-binding domain-containing protein [Rubrobacter xylanophilus]BBL79208.1 sugar ABC transporter substrate-binding protein [Rubrobacter xylanophilus]
MNPMNISRRDFLKFGGAGVAGAALLGITGCGRGGGQGEEGEGARGLVERGSIRIEMPTHMIPPDPNTAIMQNGAEQAARDMGVDVQFRGPDNFDIPEIQRIFEAAVAAEPDGIAATLPDADALGPIIRRAVEQGIPVVLFNAGLDHYKELGALTYYGQTEYEAGVEAGKRMSREGVDNLLVINHQQGQLTLETRYEGCRDGLGGTVKQIAVDGSDPTATRNGIETALRQNPDANGMITLGPGVAEQAMRAIRSAGRQDSVKLATFDISKPVLRAVQDGRILFAIDQQMFLQTYLSAVTLATYILWRLSPVSAAPTGPSFVTADNAEEIIELAGRGIH